MKRSKWTRGVALFCAFTFISTQVGGEVLPLRLHEDLAPASTIGQRPIFPEGGFAENKPPRRRTTSKLAAALVASLSLFPALVPSAAVAVTALSAASVQAQDNEIDDDPLHSAIVLAIEAGNEKTAIEKINEAGNLKKLEHLNFLIKQLESTKLDYYDHRPVLDALFDNILKILLAKENQNENFKLNLKGYYIHDKPVKPAEVPEILLSTAAVYVENNLKARKDLTRLVSTSVFLFCRYKENEGAPLTEDQRQFLDELVRNLTQHRMKGGHYFWTVEGIGKLPGADAKAKEWFGILQKYADNRKVPENSNGRFGELMKGVILRARVERVRGLAKPSASSLYSLDQITQHLAEYEKDPALREEVAKAREEIKFRLLQKLQAPSKLDETVVTGNGEAAGVDSSKKTGDGKTEASNSTLKIIIPTLVVIVAAVLGLALYKKRSGRRGAAETVSEEEDRPGEETLPLPEATQEEAVESAPAQPEQLGKYWVAPVPNGQKQPQGYPVFFFLSEDPRKPFEWPRDRSKIFQGFRTGDFLISTNMPISQVNNVRKNVYNFKTQEEFRWGPLPVKNPGGETQFYWIMGELGRGGMGSVMEAWDPKYARVVAVKILSAPQPDETTVKRFRREAELQAKASAGPNIVHIHKFWESPQLLCVMEKVDSPTLSQVLKQRRGALPMEEVTNIGIKTAAALQFVHSQGIIHRDIKPANIFWNAKSEELRVGDFGLAYISGRTQLTATGTIMGTLDYMPPEQFEEKKSADDPEATEQLDARADIYSMGAVLFHLVNGYPPFVGVDMRQMFKNIIQGNRIGFLPEVPDDLRKIIEKAMKLKREDRYRSAGEMLKDLKEFQEKLKRSQQVIPAPVPQRVVWHKRMMVILFGVAAALLIAVLVLIGRKPSKKLTDAVQDGGEAATSTAKPTPEEKNASQAKEKALAALHKKFNQLLEKDKKQEALETLDEAIKINPGEPIYELEKTKIYLDKGDKTKAVEALEKFKKKLKSLPEKRKAEFEKRNARQLETIKKIEEEIKTLGKVSRPFPEPQKTIPFDVAA